MGSINNNIRESALSIIMNDNPLRVLRSEDEVSPLSKAIMKDYLLAMRSSPKGKSIESRLQCKRRLLR